MYRGVCVAIVACALISPCFGQGGGPGPGGPPPSNPIDCMASDGYFICPGAWPGLGNTGTCVNTLCSATTPNPTCTSTTTWTVNVSREAWDLVRAKFKSPLQGQPGNLLELLAPFSCSMNGNCTSACTPHFWTTEDPRISGNYCQDHTTPGNVGVSQYGISRDADGNSQYRVGK